MEKKITKTDYFKAIKAMVYGEATDIDVDASDIRAFCDKEIEALAQRAEYSRKKAAEKRAKGDELAAQIKGVLTDEFQTVAEILAALGMDDITPQKITARMKAFIDHGEVEKTKVSVTSSDGKKLDKTAYRLIR